MVVSMSLIVSREKTARTLIIILVVASWVIYPLTMLYFLARAPIQLIFSGLFWLVSLTLFAIKAPRLPVLGTRHYIIMIIWVIYLYFLLFSSVMSYNIAAIGYFMNFFVKVIFFFILLIYLDQYLVNQIFKVYAYMMLFFTIMAIFVAVGVAFHLLQPIYYWHATTPLASYDADYYLGAVYGYSKVTAPFLLYRLQSYSGEPGSFALVLAPALYWFMFVDKNKIKIAIIAAGLVGTFSVGIALCFLLLLLVVALSRKRFIKFLVLAFVFILMFSPFLVTASSYVDRNTWTVQYLLSKFVGPLSSFGDRTQEIEKTSAYLAVDPVGTGAGLGMTTVKDSVSNGYVKAFLEAGYFGGIFYSMLFLMMGIQAYQVVRHSLKGNLPQYALALTLGLSVITVLFMGSQRDQPDLSFWHMWLYASLFIVSSKRWSFTDA